ncbi:MAG: Fe-S cluster assembly sulfur transfer protein SufU [Verrucomicrobiales bacterium]
MTDDLSELYQQLILDHSKNPQNFRTLETANRIAEGHNPLCGDNYKVFMVMENDVVRDLAFQGSGCAISKASASMMTQALKGKTKQEAQEVFQKFHEMVTSGIPRIEELGKLGVFAGVAKFPSRVKCAILAWHALSANLENTGTKVSTE